MTSRSDERIGGGESRMETGDYPLLRSRLKIDIRHEFNEMSLGRQGKGA
jgi:hypothetical protein